MKCEKHFLTKRNFIKHYVPCHELDAAWNVRNVFDENKIHQTSWALAWTRCCIKCEKRFWRGRISADIMFHTMNSRLHEMWEIFFDEKVFYQTLCCEPWSKMQLKVLLNISMNCNVREMRETFLSQERY